MGSKIFYMATAMAERNIINKSSVVVLERGQHTTKPVLAENFHCFVWKDRKLENFVDTICKCKHMDMVTLKFRDDSCSEGGGN